MFNILTTAWIPVVDSNSKRHVVRLSDLCSSDYVDIAWNRADFRIATYELLIGLLTIMAAPRETRSWHRLFETPPSSQDLESWARPFIDCFNLDGDGPRFLQDIEPLDGDPVPPQGLLIDAPGGNTMRKNADFFIRGMPHRVFSRAGAMMALFTLQAFAPSGGVGHRTSMRGGGPMTTLLVPRPNGEPPSLWQRLWAHVPVLIGDDAFPEDSRSWPNVFPWLAPTRTSEKGEIVERYQVHHLQSYFGMPRRIRLEFAPNETLQRCPLTGIVDDIVVTGYVTRNYGVNYGVWNHPLTPYYRPKTTNHDLPVHPKGGTLCYRDWIGISFSAEDDGKGQRKEIAQAVKAFRAHMGDFGDKATILAAGYAMNNASVKEFTEATIPLFRAANDGVADDLDAFANALVGAAQQTESRLRSELAAARSSEKNESMVAAFADAFWTETENLFRKTLADATDWLNRTTQSSGDAADPMPKLREDWRNHLIETALALFDEAIPPEELLSMSGQRATYYIKARQRILWLRMDAKFNERLGLPVPPKRKRKEAERG